MCMLRIPLLSLEYDSKFHRAIRKYGVENFNVETIENIRVEELQERERYWITYYDSYNCGYNSTLGGDGQCKYNYDEIVEYYLTHNYNLSETCKNFGIYDQVVYNALKHSNIDYKSLPKSYSKKKVGKPILLVEKNIIFKSFCINYFYNIIAIFIEGAPCICAMISTNNMNFSIQLFQAFKSIFIVAEHHIAQMIHIITI